VVPIAALRNNVMNQELEDQLYARVAQEIATKEYQPAPMARAMERAAGNADIARSLYIKFRVEQLAREVEQENQRSRIEAEGIARIAAESRRQRSIAQAQKRRATFLKVTGIVIAAIIGIAFLLLIALTILGLLLAYFSGQLGVVWAISGCFFDSAAS
jgi:hypothetical protein